MASRGLVLDLDGTLVRGGRVSDAEMNALRWLIRRGVPVVIATGRTVHDAAEIIYALGVREPLIALAGAQVFDPLRGVTEEVMPLPANVVEAFITWAASRDVPVRLVRADDLTTVAADPLPLRGLGGYTDVLNVILHMADQEKQEALLEFLEAQQPECQVWVRRRVTICHHSDTNKGMALERLAARRGWDLRQFVAVGNDLLDLPLFQVVGYGIAVGRKQPELVAEADAVIGEEDPLPILTCISRYFDEEGAS